MTDAFATKSTEPADGSNYTLTYGTEPGGVIALLGALSHQTTAAPAVALQPI